jgi:hypothetical protein
MKDGKKVDDLSEAELDQIIQDMAKEDQDSATEAAPKTAPSSPALAPVVSLPSSASGPSKAMKTNGQKLSLELTGSIQLKLQFSSGEKSLELECGEDHLLCRLADGSEFKIPFHSSAGSASKRKTA